MRVVQAPQRLPVIRGGNARMNAPLFHAPDTPAGGVPVLQPNPSPGSQMNHWCEKMWPPTDAIRAFSAGTSYKHASDAE
jgi:hypothetical protein